MANQQFYFRGRPVPTRRNRACCAAPAQSHSPSPSGGSSRGASRSRTWKLAIMSRTASSSLFRPWLWFRPSAAPSSGLSPCGNEACLSRASPGTQAQPPSSPGARVHVSDRPGGQRDPWPHRGEGALVCLGWRPVPGGTAQLRGRRGAHTGRRPAPGQPTYLRGVIWQQRPEEESDCVSVADGTQPEREGQQGQEAAAGTGREATGSPAWGWPFKTAGATHGRALCPAGGLASEKTLASRASQHGAGGPYGLRRARLRRPLLLTRGTAAGRERRRPARQ